MHRGVYVFLVCLTALAGCLDDSTPDAAPPANDPVPPLGAHLGLGPAARFSLPLLVDEGRAGGEPVIAVTNAGTILVAAHPGYTHVHPTVAVPPGGPEAVVPTQAQSYMWRSTDAGTTWDVVTLLPLEDPPNAGPRGVGQGVSDPDFSVAPNGRIFFTDLEALASASVSWSDDDGATWLAGNNFASGGFVDRQWLATHNDTVYFRGNGANDVRKSEDGGTTWENVGNAGCGGDIVANPLNGHLFVGCGSGFTLSVDGGATWEGYGPDNLTHGGPIENEPAIDAAGTVYIAADPSREDVVLAWTPDEGQTWGNLSLVGFFPELANGTTLWPWASAGSAGRVSVTFYGSPTPNAYAGHPEAEWFVYNAIVINATGTSPEVYPTRVTPEAIHVGGMCQGGTGCQATTAINPDSDRRLGDFFETTIDREGYVHIVWSDTASQPNDTISHVGYARLVDGPRLVVGEISARFPTQG